jgi:hypothetical protein
MHGNSHAPDAPLDMTSRSRPVALALALLLAPLPAAAQFSIFGRGAEEAPVPPGSVPGGQGSGGGQAPGNPSGQTAPVPSTPAPPPPPPKPVVLRAPTEDGVLNQDLRLNGRDGSFRLERIGSNPDPAAAFRPGGRSRLAGSKPSEGENGAPTPPAAGTAGATATAAPTGPAAATAGPAYRLRLSLAGSKVSRPTESCTVAVGGEEPLTVEPGGKPDGAPRFELKGASCPISFDVLDGAVWVRGPAELCTFEAQDCRADPKGLWGPEPGALFTQAKAIESARGLADRAVRENYKLLTQRAKPQDVRPIVQEQAAFSAERETLCRAYAREAAHGFCNTRFTEARAVSLPTRLGASTPNVLAEEAAATPRPRPRPPRPAVVSAPPEATQPQAQPQQQRSIFWPFFR